MKVGNTNIEIMKGDIMSLEVDAIVNPANKYLQHGGGLAGQIVRRGGYTIQKESDKLSPINVGEAVLTGAGRLPAKYIIHAVGPTMGEGDEDEKFKEAIRNILRIADEKGLKSIAIPAISTGIFRYPVKRCAENIFKVIIPFCKNANTSLERIILCLYEDSKYDVFKEEYDKFRKMYNMFNGK
ncbi:O-acetyl-ADP-ribose deacetylase [candidate division TA06 bacterium]|uniref:O-acetyl-ADP-ribose deacetylase n=1 Tax=candidate division TA06 bacterium TaxID=2250710 RepID=A0A660SDK6_UNCT6|nr:MAG: O-acetyl-ADP-ribose deacetylase [candidate division TA06 bacterium]